MNCCAIIRVSKIRHTCRAVPVGVLLVRRGLYLGNYNAQAVGDETEFVGIAEMIVDVHLLDGGVGFGMGRHGGIGGLVRVIGIIEPLSFFECLELFDDAVGVFGIVFRYPCFDAGGVKNSHGGKGGIDLLADWLRQIHKVVEHGL